MKKTQADFLEWLGLKVGDNVETDVRSGVIVEDEDGYWLLDGEYSVPIGWFLDEEFKVIPRRIINDQEQDLLKAIDPRFKYIVRESIRSIYVYEEEPKIVHGEWRSKSSYSEFPFAHIFDGLERDVVYEIENLLKIEVVV